MNNFSLNKELSNPFGLGNLEMMHN